MVENERLRLVSEGRYPRGLDKISSAIKTNHNPFAEPHGKRNKWFVPTKTQGKKILYFTGCTAAYHENGIARSTVSILSHLGYKVSVTPDEWCCGSPLFRTGFRNLGIEQARHNADTLNKSEGEQIVVTCPGCFRAFTKDYPQLGIELKKPVLHISQLLEKHLDALRAVDFGGAITYHDPCHLGRMSEPYEKWEGKLVEVLALVYMHDPPKPIRTGARGEYDAPRNVLRQIPGIELVEMERIREYAYCCGAGAGVKAAYPDFALSTAQNRLEEAESTGAQALVSCCPFCSTNFRDGIRERGSPLEFYDLTELVARSIGGGE